MMYRMWNFFEPKDSQWYRWKLDGASLWMHKNGEEWRFALNSLPFKHLQSDASGPEPTEPPADISVSLAVAAGRKAALHPHPSPMPYLVSARNDVTIHPGTEARFTIALPPVLRVELESGYALYEGSPFTTTYAWFGDKTSGHLCLSLPIELDPECKNEQRAFDSAPDAPSAASPAYLSMQQSLRRAAQYLACQSLIHCKIVVKNKSKEPLEVKRLAIFTDLMNVYEKAGTLVSGMVVITGTSDGSLQTNIDDTGFKNLHKIHTASKTGLNEVLIMRGVSFLRNIAGL
jgi:hypothetical protein